MLVLAVSLMTALTATPRVSAQADTEKTREEKVKVLKETRKTLVAYFSWSGNTREIAHQIHERVGGILEIVTADPYPSTYDEVVEQAKREQETGYKPALKTRVGNIKS